MTFIQTFAEWLASEFDWLVIGESLQVLSRYEYAPDICMCITERVGPVVNVYHEDRTTRFIQLLWRHIYPFPQTAGTGDDATDAKYHAVQEVVDWIANRGNVSLTGWRVEAVAATGPSYIGVDEKGRHEWSANLTIMVKQEI